MRPKDTSVTVRRSVELVFLTFDPRWLAASEVKLRVLLPPVTLSNLHLLALESRYCERCMFPRY